jgi:hypothetical protein
MEKPSLTDPPQPGRDRELWFNHAAGYLLMRDIRDYAISKIDPSLSAGEEAAARTAIDHAMYGLMMVLDGVPDLLQSKDLALSFEPKFVLRRADEDEPVEVLEQRDFEGFCMGFWGWLEGDYGDYPITVERSR